MTDPATLVRLLGRRLISDAEFNQQLDNALVWARDVMRDRREPLTPHLLVFVRQATGLHLTVLGLACALSPTNKYALMTAVGRQTAVLGPVAAVFFVGEAWASTWKEGEQQPRLPPSADPGRHEIVLVSGLTLDLRCNQASIHIRRRRDGQMFPGQTITLPYGQTDAQLSANRMLAEFLRGYAAAYLSRAELNAEGEA